MAGGRESEADFHAAWLGMVQPSEGLVVSIPVLVQAQCAERQPGDAQSRLLACLTSARENPPADDLRRVLAEVLGYPDAALSSGTDAYALVVPEAHDTLRPSLALRDPSTGAVLALAWQLPSGLDMDSPEATTGPWHYPPAAKLDRLLRHARIPIGLLSNGAAIRLIYAPLGEASGSLTFRVPDMLEISGRPIFDAFVMLLSAHRLYGVDPARALPRILEDSRRWQSTVSERLATQVKDAATLLLSGLEEAALRDRSAALADAMSADEHGGDQVHRGILAALLRIVFLLYAEDGGLLPVEHPTYRSALSVGQLFDDLRADAGAHPDQMSSRFGAWGRLLAAFRAVFLGVRHGDLDLPARRGALFDPHRFPFLEGWGPAGSAPITDAAERAQVTVPSVSDATVLAVLERLVMLDGQRLSYRSLDVEQIGSVYESMLGYTVGRLPADDARPGALSLEPRRSLETATAHYTPRSLCRPLVTRVLEPLLRALGPAPTATQLLSLKVCDPAMGSGAFLVEACRVLAEHVHAAWQREGLPAHVVASRQDALVAARRVVAQRCLYGVDRNADAVELGKLSLWLVTLARDLPFTFVDHALRHGDSLVGLDLEQIARFHWDAAEPDPTLAAEVQAALGEALPIRTHIEALAEASSAEAQADKQQLLWDAEDAVARLRTIGDLVLAAFFAGRTRAEREAKRRAFRDAAIAWLRDETPLPEDVADDLARLRSALRPFHWLVELPEIFDVARTDPLAAGQATAIARMDAFLGNMPFIGGRKIATVHGERYAEWICRAYDQSGEVDYVGYFFMRGDQLLGTSGTIGFIATNSIAQGDTRRGSLQRLIAAGLTIYDARTFVPWPGGANVFVAPVAVAKGKSRDFAMPARLNEREVPFINSRLRGYAERDDPKALAENAGVALLGCFLRGEGFVLSPEEAREHLRAAPQDAPVIRPYLVGDDIAKSPTQSASRFVVDLAAMDRPEIEQRFPKALAVVEQRVRPAREKLKTTGADAPHRRYWWRFANTRSELRAWLATHETCLVLPRVAKHLMIARVPTNQVFSEQVVVFTTESMAAFAVLQSRVHEVWTRLLTSTMGEGLRYSATECFDTFPFPYADPRAEHEALADIGRRVMEARAAYMRAENVGLTTTYNRMKDAHRTDASVVELRALHEEMDVAILAAYASTLGRCRDIRVPRFEEADRSSFEDQVIDALFAAKN